MLEHPLTYMYEDRSRGPMTQVAWRKIPVQIGSSHHLLVRDTRSRLRSNRDRKGTTGQIICKEAQDHPYLKRSRGRGRNLEYLGRSINMERTTLCLI